MSDNIARSVLTDALIAMVNVFKQAGIESTKED